MSNPENQKTVANLVISCLEAEGVENIFGIPGEENIRLVDATAGSKISFILIAARTGCRFHGWTSTVASPARPASAPRH
jgi:hypothetical protein